MATSGNFRTSNKYIVYWIEAIINSQSIANNTSNVTVRVWIKRTNTGYTTWGSGTVYCTIDGKSYSGSITPDDKITSTPRKLFERTVTINHNTNGTKTLVMSARIQHSQFSSSSQSWNYTLPTIPRYAKITSYSISDIRCTQFKINYSTDKTVDATQYRLNGGSWHTLPSNGIITGLNPGTSYKVQIRVRSSTSGLWTNSVTRTINTVALSTAKVPNINVGDSVSVSISRANSNMYHDVTLQFWHDDQTWRDLVTLSNRTTSAVFNLTTEQINQIYYGRTTSKTASIRVKVVNRWGSGGAVQGTNYSSQATATITNANPSIDSVSYKDINTSVQAIINNNQKILRNKSDLQVITGLAKAQKGATLKSYKVTIGGSEYSTTASGTEQSGRVINVGKVNQANNQTAVLTVTDSRGYTATRSFVVQIIDYQEPTLIHASVDRLNNYEEPSYLNVESRRSIVKPDGTDVNSIEMRYRIKEMPNGEWSSYTTVPSEEIEDTYVSENRQIFKTNYYMGDYPNDKSYTVDIQMKDKFSPWLYCHRTLSKGIALLQFLEDKIKIGAPFVLLKDELAFGKEASAVGVQSIALGFTTSAVGYRSIALGYGASAVGYRSIALGSDTSAEGYRSTALGDSASASGDNSTALGDSASTNDNYSIALGSDTSASGEYSTALGDSASAEGYRSTALGNGASASGDRSTALGNGASASGDRSTALGDGASAPNADEGVLGWGLINWKVPGSFTVTGTKNFEIPHPKPEKSATHVIRHSSVESPTAGDTLYRYKVQADKDNDIQYIDLPDYFIYLNKDVQIFVTPQGHFGNGYGELNRETEQLEIHCQYEGEYNVLVIGTRNDSHQSIQDWGIKGVEREIGESWTGETYVFEVDEIMEIEEIKEEG